jgi:hypothetical protein
MGIRMKDGTELQEGWPPECKEKCGYRYEYQNDFLQSNALRVEIVSPAKHRCSLRQPEHLKKHDPTGSRWILSGGSLLNFKQCIWPGCPCCPAIDTEISERG